MARIPLSFLTSTVNSSGTLDTRSAALRTRRVLATVLVSRFMTLFSLAPRCLFFSRAGGVLVAGAGGEDWVVGVVCKLEEGGRR